VRFRVVAAYVTCRSAEAALLLPGRKQVLAHSGYNAGALLPESVPQEDLDHLLANHLIEPEPGS
jgi:hypothetical protein